MHLVPFGYFFESRIDGIGVHIFRLAEWPIALIVSQEVKRLFESRHLSGLKYERVD